MTNPETDAPARTLPWGCVTALPLLAITVATPLPLRRFATFADDATAARALAASDCDGYWRRATPTVLVVTPEGIGLLGDPLAPWPATPADLPDEVPPPVDAALQARGQRAIASAVDPCHREVAADQPVAAILAADPAISSALLLRATAALGRAGFDEVALWVTPAATVAPAPVTPAPPSVITDSAAAWRILPPRYLDDAPERQATDAELGAAVSSTEAVVLAPGPALPLARLVVPWAAATQANKAVWFATPSRFDAPAAAPSPPAPTPLPDPLPVLRVTAFDPWPLQQAEDLQWAKLHPEADVATLSRHTHREPSVHAPRLFYDVPTPP